MCVTRPFRETGWLVTTVQDGDRGSVLTCADGQSEILLKVGGEALTR